MTKSANEDMYDYVGIWGEEHGVVGMLVDGVVLPM